jgi:hypothetical protein
LYCDVDDTNSCGNEEGGDERMRRSVRVVFVVTKDIADANHNLTTHEFTDQIRDRFVAVDARANDSLDRWSIRNADMQTDRQDLVVIVRQFDSVV